MGKTGARDVPAADDHGGEERDLETSFSLSAHDEQASGRKTKVEMPGSLNDDTMTSVNLRRSNFLFKQFSVS